MSTHEKAALFDFLMGVAERSDVHLVKLFDDNRSQWTICWDAETEPHYHDALRRDVFENGTPEDIAKFNAAASGDRAEEGTPEVKRLSQDADEALDNLYQYVSPAGHVIIKEIRERVNKLAALSLDHSPDVKPRVKASDILQWNGPIQQSGNDFAALLHMACAGNPIRHPEFYLVRADAVEVIPSESAQEGE